MVQQGRVWAALLVIALSTAGAWYFTSGKPVGPKAVEPAQASDSSSHGDEAEHEQDLTSSALEAPQAQASLPHQESEAPSTRDAIPASDALLSGRVVKPDGTALAEAQVSWTSWSPELADHALSKALPSASLIEASSRIVSTGPDGRFFFDETPNGLDDAEQSIVWVTHPSGFAKSFKLGAERESWPQLENIVLQPAPSMRAHVSLADQDVPEAKVWQRASAHRTISSRGAPTEVAIPVRPETLVFLRSYTTGDRGEVALAPAEHLHYVQAKKGARLSMPWVGTGRPLVELELAPTFTVEGTVYLPELDESFGLPRVLIHRQRAGLLEELVSAAVDADGLFGPVEVPILPADEYVAHLDGGVIAPQERAFSAPQPGETLTLEFDAKLGHPFWIYGIDENEEIIPGAEVTIRWEQDGRRVEKIVRARDDGYILVTAVPPGEVSGVLRAPGYRLSVFEGVLIPEPTPVAHEYLMSRAYPIEGVCLRDGKPASDFEVRYWWVGAPQYSDSVVVRGSPDGRFMIENAAPDLIGIEAFTPGFLRSQRVFVDSMERDSFVTLELTDPRVAKGVVVSAETGKTLPMALIQMYGSDQYRLIDPIGSPERVQLDGSFELAKLGPGTGVLSVEAPGYAPRLVHYREGKGEVEDLGVIELENTQTLEVRIISDEAVDYSSYTLVAGEGARIPATAFSSEGKLRIDDVSPGTFVFTVQTPQDWCFLRESQTLAPGEDWSIVFDLTGQCDVSLVVTRGEDECDLSTVDVMCSLKSASGSVLIREVSLDKDGRGILTGVHPGSLDVWARNQDASIAGSLVRVITEDDREVTLEIPLTDRHIRFRVLDSESQPISGVMVSPFNSDGLGLGFVGKTDTSGECQVEITAGMDLVSLTDAAGGVMVGLPLNLPGDDDEFVELVFDASSSLDVHITGDAPPASGLACRLHCPTLGMSVVAPQGPDASGHVLFERIGAGSYVLKATGKDCWPISQVVTVSESSSSVSITLRRLGAVEFKVFHADGSRARGQTFDISCEDLGESVAQWIADEQLTGASLTTDEHGQLRIEGLPRGRYSWSCAGGSGAFEIRAGELNSLRIDLP